MQRRHAIVAVLAGLLLVPALAMARPRGPSPEEILHNPRLLARFLRLTPEQVTQEQALFQTLNTALRGIHDQQKTAHDGLAAELAKESPDACTAGGFVVELDALAGQARAALETFDTDFSAILTPEQLAKYQALKDAAHLGDS